MTRKQQRPRSASRRIALLLAFILFLPAIAAAQVYTVISFDSKGDGRDASLADAAQLSYRHDKEQDFLWFRIALYGKANEQTFGVNLVIDSGGDEASKLNWWGGTRLW